MPLWDAADGRVVFGLGREAVADGVAGRAAVAEGAAGRGAAAVGTPDGVAGASDWAAG